MNMSIMNLASVTGVAEWTCACVKHPHTNHALTIVLAGEPAGVIDLKLGPFSLNKVTM